MPLPTRWEIVGCLLCENSADVKVVWPDTGRGDIVRCGQCDLVFRTPRPLETDLTQYFEQEWTEARLPFFLEEYRISHLERIRDWIIELHPAPGTILDVGSSYGHFLSLFPSAWTRFGIEPSGSACRIAKQRLPGAWIMQGTLSSAALAPERFDIIAMVDTIYYLPQPLRDLQKLRQSLKEGGLFLVEAPNFDNRSYIYRWLRASFPESWLYFYTPQTLEKLITRAGLRVLSRMDLPGHSLGGRSLWKRSISIAEFSVLQTLRKLTRGRLDLIPHILLIAQR